VLSELIRSGAVQSVEEHRVRMRSRSARKAGVSPDNVALYGLQARAILQTLTQKLCDPASASFVETTAAISVTPQKLPLIREIVVRRSGAFLTGLERELSQDAGRPGQKKVQLSVSVVEHTGPVRARRRRNEAAR
jgi:hypothetical protein